MFVALCQPIASVCRAQTEKAMATSALTASAALFIAPAGFAKMLL
jgi:hypothetical protein